MEAELRHFLAPDRFRNGHAQHDGGAGESFLGFLEPFWRGMPETKGHEKVRARRVHPTSGEIVKDWIAAITKDGGVDRMTRLLAELEGVVVRFAAMAAALTRVARGKARRNAVVLWIERRSLM